MTTPVTPERLVQVLRAYFRCKFVPPFTVEPLHGKYYGTHVVDADGREVIEFWSAEGEPSGREKAEYGADWSPQAWAEYCCDRHWECQADHDAAEAFAALLNEVVEP